MPAPENISALIAQFDYHLDAYKKGQYNETQVRLDYINPLMEALGCQQKGDAVRFLG